jgi:ribosomal protein S18 acetylase RimI-like enzyme
MRWLNADPQFVPHLANALKITPTAAACQLSEFDNEVPIAGVLFDGYNDRSIHAHIWIAPAHRPSRLFYWAVCDYVFNQLKVQNVVGTVPSSCELALRLNRHLGFRVNSRIPNYYPTGDDMIIMICTPETVFDFERLSHRVKRDIAEITIAA